MALLVEVVMDGPVYGGEFLECSHPPEAEHRPLSSSQRLVRILGAVVDPAARHREWVGLRMRAGYSLPAAGNNLL